MAEELTIRDARPEDAEQILAYLNQIGGESDNLLFGKDGFHMSVEQEREFLKSFSQSGRSCWLLGLRGEEIVSVASIQGSERERIAHRGNLAISVKKTCWHQGIGRRMMEELIAFAKTHGITVIELEVMTKNSNAIALYRKMGFEQIGTYRKFSRVRGIYHDAELMNLYLD